MNKLNELKKGTLSLSVSEINEKEQEPFHQQKEEAHEVKNGGGIINGQFFAQNCGDPGHNSYASSSVTRLRKTSSKVNS